MTRDQPHHRSIQYFRDEYIAHLTMGRCPFDPNDAVLFTTKETVSA